MTLVERINNDLKNAMRNKDQTALRALRGIKSALLIAQTDGSNKELNEEGEIKILQKLIKQRKDSLEIYKQQNREDLAAKEIEEIEVIQKYLPQQMSEEAITALVRTIIQTSGAQGIKDMGKVMAEASKQLAGKAEGKVISEIVKRELAV